MKAVLALAVGALALLARGADVPPQTEAADGSPARTYCFYHELLNVPAMHAKGITGKGVRVGVVDDGIYPVVSGGETDLAFAALAGTPQSGYHGTSVCSLIGSKRFGLAPDCEIWAYNSGDAQGQPGLDRTLAGLWWCATNGCRVINMSFGFAPDKYTDAQRIAFDAELAEIQRRTGVILINGNGNNPLNDLNYFPQDSECVIAIGGLKPDKTPALLTNSWRKDFCTFGDDVDDFIRPDGTVGKFDGTSCACPLATALVALLLQQEPSLTQDEVYGIFKDSAEVLAPGRTREYGWGLLQACEVPATYKRQSEYDAERAAWVRLQSVSITNRHCTYTASDNFYEITMRTGSVIRLLLSAPVPANATDPNVYWYCGNNDAGSPISLDQVLTAPDEIKTVTEITINGQTVKLPTPNYQNVYSYQGLNANYEVLFNLRVRLTTDEVEIPPEEDPNYSPPRPVARWDVVPYRRFDGVFKAGVVAFHEDGVKVTFSYADRTFVAEEPKYNDRVNVWEYFVPIDAATLPDGEITVAARATTLGANPVSFDLPPLTLYANHGGTVGSTESITVGPTNSLKAAIASVGDGGTVYLESGTYSLNGLGGKSGRKYWTTLCPAAGVRRGEVKFSSGRPGLDKFRLKDVLLYTDSDGYSAIVMGENGGTVCWLEDCKFTCVGGRYRGNSNLFGNKMDGFVTGGVTEGMNNGPDGSLIRDHYVHSIAADTWTGSGRLVVNCHVDDVDPGSSGAHPDFFQSHAVAPDWCHDVILYNVSGWDCKSQGLFGWRLKDAAFVNIVFHLEGGNFTSQFSGDLDNVLFAHITLVDQTWNWREGFAPKNVRSINGVYGNMIVYGPDVMKTDGSTGLTVDHNAFYGKKSKTSAAASDWGLHAVTIDRAFVGEEGHDYSLGDGSAALTNGIPLQCVPTDLNGNPYPTGARPCGAYTTAALATRPAKVWVDDWEGSGGDSPVTPAEDGTLKWFDVRTAFAAGEDVVLTGRAQAASAPRTAKPDDAPFAFTFENVGSRVYPLAYAGDGWQRFGAEGFAEGEWVAWKVEFDCSSASAPRVKVTVGTEASEWMPLRLTASIRLIATVYFTDGDAFGDFGARVLTLPDGEEVVELVNPELARDGSGVGLTTRTGADGAAESVFALKVSNPVKGAYYTVFTTTDLKQPFTAEICELWNGGEGEVLTLEVPADAPQKFATVVVTRQPVEKGTPLVSISAAP